MRWVRWLISLALFLAFLKCAMMSAYNWWAAGFRNDPNAGDYQRLGYWYFAVALGSLIGSVWFAFWRNRKPTSTRQQEFDSHPPFVAGDH